MIKKYLKKYILPEVIAYLVMCYEWLIFKTCKIELRINSKSESLIKSNTQAIFTYWHSRILLFTRLLSPYGKYAIVASTHGDAQILASLVAKYGHMAVRGSSSKGSVNAMRGILEVIRSKKTFAITPDGPRGPRFQIKGAVTTLAAKFKLPIIPMTYSASNAIILGSWDRFIIPKPFLSRIIVEIGEPMYFEEQNDARLEKEMVRQTKKVDKELNLKVDY